MTVASPVSVAGAMVLAASICLLAACAETPGPPSIAGSVLAPPISSTAKTTAQSSSASQTIDPSNYRDTVLDALRTVHHVAITGRQTGGSDPVQLAETADMSVGFVTARMVDSPGGWLGDVVLGVGDKLYVASTDGSAPTWVLVDDTFSASDPERAKQVAMRAAIGAALDIETWVAATNKARFVGDEPILGGTGRHFSANLPIDDVIAVTAGMDDSQFQDDKRSGVTHYDVDTWIDNRGLPVTTRVTVEIQGVSYQIDKDYKFDDPSMSAIAQPAAPDVRILGTASRPAALVERIDDSTAVLSDPNARARINSALGELESRAGVQMSLLVLSTAPDGITLEDYTAAVAKASNLGSNSLLLGIGTTDQTYAVYLPDGSSVSQSKMNQAVQAGLSDFQADAFDTGVIKIIEAVSVG